jgi:ribonucleoside-diphosphate reductase alpha chain
MTKDLNGLFVTKRNGSKELFDLEKIHTIVERACMGITGVSVSDIEMKTHLNFYQNISTAEITEALVKSSADLISETSPNYQYVAANLLNYNLRKDVWGSSEPIHIYDHVVKMVELGFYTQELLEAYSKDDWNVLNHYIDHDRDFKFAYVGLREYIDKYCVRDRSLKDIKPLETPQITYMLIAATTCMQEKNMKKIKSLYNDFSQWNISLPTPIMAGLRTPTKQFSSCTVISVGDSLDSLIAGSGAIVKYVAKKAGIGLDATRIRAEGSPVGKEKGIKHTGVVPFLRMYEGALKSCSQGGVRGGSMTVHLLLWHKEIEDLLVLKNNKGTPDSRVRKMDYSIEINNYLYNRFIQKKPITLFSPNQVPDLYDAFYSDSDKFAELYEKYEKDDSLFKKTVDSVQLFTALMTERKETGRIYIFNTENANKFKPFKVPVTTSNLCLDGQTIVTVTIDNSSPVDITMEEVNDLFNHGKQLSVLSKNIHTGEIVFSSIQNSALTNPSADVIKITDEKSGKSIICTPEHKVFTVNRGYVEAAKLMQDDILDIQ